MQAEASVRKHRQAAASVRYTARNVQAGCDFICEGELSLFSRATFKTRRTQLTQ